MRKLSWPTLGIVLLLVVLSYFETDLFTRLGVDPGLTAIGAGGALIAAALLLNAHRDGWAFVSTALAMVFTIITVFRGLYPRVMVSSLNPEWSLTIYNASSSPYTLQAMTVVALIFLPIVLIYQGWTYWMFRGRITRKQKLEY
jgi:cytochrome d ubiquinol oxidase subunit II